MRYLPLIVFSSFLAVLIGGCDNAAEPPEKAAPESALSSVRKTFRVDSAASGAFTSLSSSETGLDFTASTDPEHPLARLYHSVFAAGGIAIGDLDGDTLPDLVCTNGPEKNRVFRQTAPLRFEDITAAAGFPDQSEHWSAGVSLVDFDNDGDLDIYVCNYQSANELWLNDGTGKFTEKANEYGVDINDSSVMAYFGDFDADGFVDLFLLTNRLYYEGGLVGKFNVEKDRSGRLVVEKKLQDYFRLVAKPSGGFGIRQRARADYLLMNRNGKRFEDVTPRSGIAGDWHGLSATLWDYDGDSDLDIYVCNDFNDPDSLYENQGDGTFKDVVADVFKHTSWFSMGSDAADVNNDGRLDLFTVDMSGTTHYLSKVLMGDMNTFANFLDTAEPRQYMRNFLHLNAGKFDSPTQSKSGTKFLETAQLAGVASTDWSWAPLFSDFDCDGFNDLFVSNGHIRNFNDPDVFRKKAKQITGNTYWEIFKDEAPMKQANLVFKNQNGSEFSDHSKDWGLDHVGISYAAASGDLDQDGDLDLIVMNLDEPLSVYRNDVADGNNLTVKLVGNGSNKSGIGSTARIELEDGTQQLKQLLPQRGFLANHEPLIHFGLGKARTVKKLKITWPDGRTQAFDDIEANQLVQVVEQNGIRPIAGDVNSMFAQFNNTSIKRREEKTFDDFVRQPLLPNKLSQLGPGVAVFDINDDNIDEIYLSAPAGQAKAIHLGVPSNDPGKVMYRMAPLKINSRKEELAPLAGDFDGDGDHDLYIVSGGVEADYDFYLADEFLVNIGNKGFRNDSPEALPKSTRANGTASAADFDRDGDLDIFVGGRVVAGKYPTAPASKLLRNITETADEIRFADVTEEAGKGLANVGMVTSSIWSDVNQDGWIDLLLTTEWGPIKVFLNQEGKLVEATTECGLEKHTGWWNGIAGADFDNDGDIDFVATNFGKNTKYSASKKKPVRIYYGKFGGADKDSIIEVKVAESCELPVRGKSCSQHAMPFIRDKFPTFHEFASSELLDIYSQNDLDSATAFEANTLDSCLLINDGSGKFEVSPLPWLAQASPGFGVVATDFDADGNVDILIAQNFYTAQRETGRMAGGMGAFMLGNGDGTFRSVWPSDSGIGINADAKGLAIGDFDNDLRPDFVVGINDQPPLFYRNQFASNQPYCIDLVGKAANTIGSRVKVNFEDGSSRVAETYAGGSYLSQSTDKLFFGAQDDAKMKSIEVQWPDGSNSTHELKGTKPGKLVTISKPE